jgi:hypothetical protein
MIDRRGDVAKITFENATSINVTQKSLDGIFKTLDKLAGLNISNSFLSYWTYYLHGSGLRLDYGYSEYDLVKVTVSAPEQ